MAFEIIRRMKLIEDTKHSWAITLVGKSPEKVQPILDEFHRAQVSIPYATDCWNEADTFNPGRTSHIRSVWRSVLCQMDG